MELGRKAQQAAADTVMVSKLKSLPSDPSLPPIETQLLAIEAAAGAAMHKLETNMSLVQYRQTPEVIELKRVLMDGAKVANPVVYAIRKQVLLQLAREVRSAASDAKDLVRADSRFQLVADAYNKLAGLMESMAEQDAPGRPPP
jgi:hypothetical protein